MTRERRVSPAVSSSSAARVCSMSWKPNAVEPFLRGLHRQRADAGERVEQRREEQLLVDRAHDRLVPLVLGVELRRAPIAPGRSRKPSTRARCVRASASAGSVCVWCSSTSCSRCSTVRSHTYASSRRRRVGDRDVAAGRELFERVERGAGADRVVVAAVHELEQLHRELDVADAAVAALQLAGLQPFAAQASARCAPSSRGSRAPRPDRARRATRTARRARRTSSAELGVAGDRPRLDERLELPRLRPSLPVRLVRRRARG